jgi:succinate-semialdehyde dehydrogenase/glutarate-semialdehyde dehydrogenase
MFTSPLLTNSLGYFEGRWQGARAGPTLVVQNPATGEPLASLPDAGEGEARRAVEIAAGALDAEVPLETRRGWLTAIDEALREHKEELARIITSENGKPRAEAAVEVEYAAGFFRFFAGVLDHLEPHRLPEPIRDLPWTVHYRPAGVAALITPWNFPLAMLAKKLAPALGAGCGVVMKPAEETPLTALALATILERVHVPGDRWQLVMGRPEPIGRVLCTDPRVRIISFTGSTEVGRKLMAASAPHVKRLAMELGGNAPFIVFEDVPPAAAADALMPNKFRAGGQTCVCTNRVYVHRGVAEPFTRAVADRVRRLRVGDGMDPETDIGPLINRDGFDKVAAHVADALARGATRVVGYDPPRPEHAWGAFYPPTVLAGITADMLVCREETFGPVVAIATFETEGEVIDAANATPYGLAAYLFTEDSGRAQRVIRELRFGHVGLNTGMGPAPEAPFGGMKQSGFGREGGIEGLMEFVEPQVVAGQ